ncbi:hypothetical protein F5Y15DRAFT_399674 [Xylariaceae sp. FL0016]|nr:hypothetical protein F5Y15DRAFT_399674 [Xylariaceae sp. FL0016]
MLPLVPFLVALPYLVSLVSSTIVRRSDIITVLEAAEWARNTTIEFPGSQAFSNATERWDIYEEPTFAAAVTPGTEEDVAQAVKIATANGIPFLATGARHGYTTTLGRLNQGLAIDLSLFNAVHIDDSTGIMTVGGGVRMVQIYGPVYDAGYELQIGTASCPGVVGLTLGAGVGPWAGVYGLLIDALVSLRVVTSSGDAITVSESSYPELFWAMRGAGANFGVVVSASYQLQKPVNHGQVLAVDFVIPPENNASYFELLGSYDGGNLPDNLSISSFITWNATINATQISGTWAYLGTEVSGMQEFQRLYDLNAIVSDVQVYPYSTVIQSVAGGADAFICLDGAIHDVYTVNARNLSAPTYIKVFDEVSNFFEEYPTFRTSTIQIAVFPNDAAVAVSDDATAYPWRDTLAYVDIELGWDTASGDLESQAQEVGLRWRAMLAETSGYPELAAYVNSAHGDERLESIYGARKLPRLSALKKEWDPLNVFGFNNPIPVDYS